MITQPSDYYEHHATVVLPRPLVLTGMIPTETRRIGYRLAALFGLRFTDLERDLEHREGMSMAELEDRLLPHQLRRVESAGLMRAIGELPYGVLSIGDEALSARSNLRLLRRRSFLVALEYPVRDLHRRFRQLYPLEAPRWIAEAPSPEKLAPLYRQWTRRFAGADISLPMQGLGWEQATRQLIALLTDSPASGFAPS